MTDFIEREAAKRAIFEQSHFMTLAEETRGGYGTVLWGKDIVQEETAMNALNAIPAADVRPVVRGRWVDGKCDNCGEHAPYWCLATTFHESNFCPNCGADMREVQHDS